MQPRSAETQRGCVDRFELTISPRRRLCIGQQMDGIRNPFVPSYENFFPVPFEGFVLAFPCEASFDCAPQSSSFHDNFMVRSLPLTRSSVTFGLCR